MRPIDYMKAAVEEDLRQEGRRRSFSMNWMPIDVGRRRLVEDRRIPRPGPTPRAAPSRREGRRDRVFRRDHPAASWRSRATSCPFPPSSPCRRLCSHRHHRSMKSAASRSRFPCGMPENCIQCNQCSLVCPHAGIRPFLANDEKPGRRARELRDQARHRQGFAGYKFRMQVSPLDCTGCGNCADVCPAKAKGSRAWLRWQKSPRSKTRTGTSP